MGAATDDTLWFTRSIAAALVGLGTRQFGDVIRPRLPDEAVRGEGRTLRYHGPDVVATFVSYKLEQQRIRHAEAEGPPLDIDDDGGPDSPGLERLRIARATLAEMQVDQMRDRLIPRAELEPGLAQFATTLRRAGETLNRRFGNDAGGILTEAVDEAEGAWRRMLSGRAKAEDVEPDTASAPVAGEPGQAPAPAADPAVR